MWWQKSFLLTTINKYVERGIAMIILENLLAVTPQQVIMWIIGGLLIYLAIKKGMEPTLLLPMGFGAILVNLPFSGVIDQFYNG